MGLNPRFHQKTEKIVCYNIPMALEGFLKPDEVIAEWDIRPGERVADFGCGAGFFSLPLGQRVGPSGRVYALDIREEALEATRAKIKLYHFFNVEPVRADLEAPNGSGLKNESADKVIISNILFQAENKKAVAAEAYRILRPGGSVMIIEWSDLKNTGGPSLEERIGEDEARKIFEEAKFEFVKNFDAGTHHYGLVFKK